MNTESDRWNEKLAEASSRVVVKSGIWLYLPSLFLDGTIQAIAPSIYASKKVATRIHAEYTLADRRILIHELVHIIRQEKVGAASWFLRYLCSPSFRLHEELLAIHAELRYMAYLQVLPEDVEKMIAKSAKNLSSDLYLRCVDEVTARQLLEKAWHRASRV